MKKYSVFIFVFMCMCLLGCEEKKEKKVTKYNPILTAKVKDLTSPVINSKDEYTIIIGDTFEFKKEVKVNDNTDASPAVRFEGNFNLNKVGTYKIICTAKDKDGNISKKSINLVVKEKISKEVPAESNNNHPSSNSNNDKKQQDEPPVPPPSPPSSIPVTGIEKEFLFIEGKAFNDTYNECMAYAGFVVSSKQANRGSCLVIDNKEGIHIGYHSYFK